MVDETFAIKNLGFELKLSYWSNHQRRCNMKACFHTVKLKKNCLIQYYEKKCDSSKRNLSFLKQQMLTMMEDMAGCVSPAPTWRPIFSTSASLLILPTCQSQPRQAKYLLSQPLDPGDQLTSIFFASQDAHLAVGVTNCRH